jgi:PhnB protein
MKEVELTERLDQAIEAILRAASQDITDSAVADLAEVAADLRDLPAPEFKARLQHELEQEVSMSAAAKTKQSGVKPPHSKKKPTREAAFIRKGFRTVTPYLVVTDVRREVEFIKGVFGAKGKVFGGVGSKGGFHSEYRIGDSMLMIGGGGKGSEWKGAAVPASLHVYVENVDGVYQRAIEAGATSLMPPTDMDYGERGAAIEDIDGNHWYVATAFGPSYVPEGLPTVMPFFNPVGAPKMIEFLKDALGAEEIAVHRSARGAIEHAKLRIGDAIFEMGEAHGEWQPRPMQFMVYVADCDESYERAIHAEGAISISEPANAPYGGRNGAIKDPWGNTWYLSSQTVNTGKRGEGRSVG